MKIPLLPALIASAALGLLAGCANNAAQVVAATPGCLDEVAVNRLVADYNARRPAADPPAGAPHQARLASRAGQPPTTCDITGPISSCSTRSA